MTARAALAAALTLGLLAGCGGGDEPDAAPEPTPTVTATPTATTAQVKGKGFTVTMPGKPKKTQEKPKSGPARKLTYDVWTYSSEERTYSINRVAYPSSIPVPSLSSLFSTTVRTSDGKVKSSRSFRYRGEQAYEGTFTGALKSDVEATVYARYVRVGRVVYGLVFFSESGGRKAAEKAYDAYVDSLRFQD